MNEQAFIPSVDSLQHFTLAKCLDEKLNMLVRDEAGLANPLTISLVIPTKIDVVKETREYELIVMRHVLSECSQLVDLGYLDEIIVVDGSLNRRGESDYSVLKRVVETAFDELDLFQRQVKLILENKAIAINAKNGFFDFIVKVVHQFDPNISRVLDRFNLYDMTSFTAIPSGKGAALWLSVPITKGDVVCFVDSDIMNFSKEFVVALCHPLIQTWNDATSQINMVKACYKRFTVSLELEKKHYFGGRVTRLFIIPLLRVLAEEFPNIFGGFDSLKYPLSGEFTVRKEILEDIEFPNDYGIDFSMIKQIVNKSDFSSIYQVDLGIFHHLGQSSKGLDEMIIQITNQLLESLEEKVVLSKRQKKRIISEYVREVECMLPYYRRMVDEISEYISKELNVKISLAQFYSERIELERFQRFLVVFKEALINGSKAEWISLPPWAKLEEKVNLYAVRTMLRRRTNQSTFSRLKEAGLFYE